MVEAVKGPVSSSCWLLPARALTYQQTLPQCSRSACWSGELTRKQCNVIKITTDVLPPVSHSDKNRWWYFRLKPYSGHFPGRMRSSVRSSVEKENILRPTDTPLRSSILRVTQEANKRKLKVKNVVKQKE